MAVLFDAVGAGGYNIGAAGATTVNTKTFAHTVAADANCIVVALQCWDNNNVASVANHSRTVTYGGVAMTSLGATNSSSGIDGFIEWFYLLNPPTGTNNVIVTVTRTGGTGANTWAILTNSLSYKNVASVVAGAAQAVASGTPSVTINSASGRRVAAMLSAGVNDPGGYNQTSRSSILTTNYSFGFASHSVIGDAAGATTVTQSENATGNILMAQGIDLVEAGAVAPTGQFFAVL